MLQVRRSVVLSFLLVLLYFYSLIPTESEVSTFPLIVRTSAALAIVFVAIANLNEIRAYYSIPVVFVLLYLLVLSAVSFSLRYFVNSVVVLAAFFWALAYFQSHSFRSGATLALDMLIYGSAFFLVLQFFEYYLTGNLFDYHNLFFPWSESRLPLWSSLARVGGVYIEPGTYANWIYVLLILRIFLEKQIGSVMVPLVAVTMMLSMSAWGVIIGLFVLTVYVIRGFDYKFILLVLVIFFGVAAGAVLIDFGDVVHFLENRVFYSGSRNVRDDTFIEFIRVLPDVLIFGLGFGKVFCVDCLSPQDAGLVISLVTVYGLVFSCLFVSIVYYYAYLRGGWRLIFLCLPLLNTKLFYWDHVLWFLFMIGALGLMALRLYPAWDFSVKRNV